jgi:hypothetical protein
MQRFCGKNCGLTSGQQNYALVFSALEAIASMLRQQ